MFAAWAVGAVPQPISDRLPPLERAAIVDLADPALMVGAPPRARARAPGRSWSRYPRTCLPARSRRVCRRSGTHDQRRQHRAAELIGATQPALFESVGPAGALVCLRPDGCVLMTGPLAHNGPFVATTCAMLLGNHVVLMPRFDPPRRCDWSRSTG